MPYMTRTADVFHELMSGLHVLLPALEPPHQALNRQRMSVMALTSQSAMLPYAPRAKDCEDELHCLRKGNGLQDSPYSPRRKTSEKEFFSFTSK